MAALDNTKKSARLLASRRYTHDTLTDSQEAFTSTLDINANEVYVDQSLIPSSGLPFSGSGQNGSTYSVGGQGIVKYWYRQPLTKSDLNNEAWFFLSPSGSNAGIGAQLIDANQKGNFVSPKYSVPALTNANTEDATPGYGVKVFVSTNSTTPSSGDQISVNNFSFDYKTGVLQFVSSAVAPTAGQYVYVTVYQYVGRVLSDNITSVSSSISALSASLGGSGGGGSIGDRVTNLEYHSASVNSFTSSQTTQNSALATITGSLISSASIDTTKFASLATYTSSLNTYTASLETKNSSLATISGSLIATASSHETRINQLGSFTGSYATTGSNTFRGNQTISGSMYVTGDIIIFGSSSTQNISSSTLNVGTNIITVNTLAPQARFGGLAVIDSGSAPTSGSLFYDSVDDEWVFVHRGIPGAAVTTSIVITGPETYDNLGNETRLTTNRIAKFGDSFHVYDSNITDDGTTVSFSTGVNVTGSIRATSFSGSIAATNGVVSGSSQVDVTATTNFTSYSSSVSASISALSASVGSGNVGQSITQLNSFSSSVLTQLSTLGTYTSSLETKNSALATVTGSLISSASIDTAKFATLSTYTASVNSQLSAIGSYTSSQDTKNATLATYTGSLETKNSALATYTGSLETKNSALATISGSLILTASNNTIAISNINAETASIETRFTTLASYTGSLESKNTSLATITGSLILTASLVETKNATLATYTASLETKNSTLATYTASLETKNSALATVTGSLISSSSIDQTRFTTLGTYTGSIDTKFSTLATYTGSLETKNSTLATYTGSLETKNSSLATITGSLISSASIDQARFTTLATYTGSLETKNSSLATITGSLIGSASSQNSRITTLEGTGTIQGLGTSNNVTFNSVITNGNVVVGGDLVVQGNTVTLNTSQLIIEDKVITLASGSTSSITADGSGIEVAGANVNFVYQHSTTAFTSSVPIITPAVTSSVNIPSGGGNSKRIAFRGTTDNIEFVAAPTTSGDLVQWDGTNFVMSNTIDGGSF